MALSSRTYGVSTAPNKKMATALAKKLHHLLANEKYYQNTDLDLQKLSYALGLSKRKTSQLIQRQYNKSFTACVNDFRLQEVLYRFKNQKYRKVTIIALALEAGFPSKSTFYRYFKTRLGRPPSAFIAQIAYFDL